VEKDVKKQSRSNDSPRTVCITTGAGDATYPHSCFHASILLNLCSMSIYAIHITNENERFETIKGVPNAHRKLSERGPECEIEGNSFRVSELLPVYRGRDPSTNARRHVVLESCVEIQLAAH
jgi:hypothetical protein